MNEALLASSRPIVLFLDDDIVPAPDLIAAHAARYDSEHIWAVAGQVLQPGEEPLMSMPRYRTHGFHRFLDFPFNASRRASIENGMAGNLSMRREAALGVGGFDENFVGVAYRFETEFCRRLCQHGGRIEFEPAASIRHLRAPSGGTRVHGDFRTSASPFPSVGAYYFALRAGLDPGAAAYILRRPLQAICTRFHLRQPWWIPVKALGEARALTLALRLMARGPKLLDGVAAGVKGRGDADSIRAAARVTRG